MSGNRRRPTVHATFVGGVVAALCLAATTARADDAGTPEDTATGKAGDTVVLDEISVTATREERATKEVPSNIAVIGKQKIDQEKMFNIKDAIQGTPGVLIDSKNGGFDVRLVIRGAGQKANYGVREIMVLRDGVPMTDPDSFTRFDFIDTQDIERIEITKGPGSIYGGGSAGGVVQIISKSVFDAENRVRAGAGNQDSFNGHVRYGDMIGDSDALALTVSRRSVGNHWRRWNEFETNQFSLKHGHMFGDGSAWETEVSYSEANLQLPGTMGDSEFADYLATGKQTDTGDAFKFMGRDSKIFFVNSKYEAQWGDFTFKPRLYFNQWGHFHPVTGKINDAWNNYVYGADVEGGYRHRLLGPSSLVAGFTLRQDRSDDAEQYAYRDYTTCGVFCGFRITEVLSDQKGDLISTEDTLNTLFGVYAQESVRPIEGLLVDVGMRYDRSSFEIDSNEIQEYSYSAGKYVAGAGITHTEKTYDLFSPRIGASYALTDAVSAFASLAQSDQVPSTSEIKSNSGLDAATARSVEVGLKGRARGWSFDTSLYYTLVDNEIVAVNDNGETVFQNAGEVTKKGFEFAGDYELLEGLRVGATYAYSDYTFDKFSEVVSGSTVDRSGNRMPFVPKHQYGLFASYSHPSGWHARVETNSWGEYWMDNANTEKYGGYDFVTDLSIGYRDGPHTFALNVDNVFDKRYAVEAKKSAQGRRSYSAGQPRTFLVTYTRKF
jgi:iron complex outermembrane receptor protein